jgi:molecular chaperone Hsp33
MPSVELKTDVAIGVAIPARNARGRVARLGSAVDAILASHEYPPVIEKLLAEALVLTALFGALLKEPGGQITLQAQTEAGIIDLLVCDYLGGELRGYIRHDPERLADAGPNPSLFALFGKGYLAITFDHPVMEGEEGRTRIHTRLDHPDWPHIAILAGSVKSEELTDPNLPLDDLIWRLFHEEDEVRTLPAIKLTRGCRCDPVYVRSVIARFPDEEREAMIGEDGMIRVDCQFCSTSFAIEPSELSGGSEVSKA